MMTLTGVCGPSPCWHTPLRASTSAIWPLALLTTPMGMPAACSAARATKLSGMGHRHVYAFRVCSSTRAASATSASGTPTDCT